MKLLDLTGVRFGKLVVFKKSTKKLGRDVAWDCQCDCGNVKSIRGGTLRNGASQSCGCSTRTVGGAAIERTKTYMVWGSMLSRCTNPASQAFSRYGGRGIVIDERWMSFNNFLSDMGEKPEGMSLDRIDNNAGYSKSNCRWADKKTQARNRESNRLVEYEGIKKPTAEWSEILGWPHHVICSRLREGWTDEKALTTPRRWKGDSQEEIISALQGAAYA
jgi:hypothetical protein